MNDNDIRWRTVAVVPSFAADRHVAVQHPDGTTSHHLIVAYGLQRSGCLRERFVCLVLTEECGLVAVDDLEGTVKLEPLSCTPKQAPGFQRPMVG